MRVVDVETAAAWKAMVKGDSTTVGDQRPTIRATIQRLQVHQTSYDLAQVFGTPRTGQGQFRSYVFAQEDQPVEIPNIRSLRWERTTDTDAATMRMTLWNTEVLPIGASPEAGASANEFERPGWLTYNRGESTEAQSRWGYQENGWRDLIVPDRVIRTYEGYGTDGPAVAPEDDTRLYPSGVWIIDRVAYDANGVITVEARDAGRLLLDQIIFVPIVPDAEYPLIWERYHDVPNPDIVTTTSGWLRPRYSNDSNQPYVGRGFWDGNMPYVQSNGAVLGHHGKHAFDASTKTYWLSVGNYPGWSSAFEWVQGKFAKGKITAVKVRSWGGPYKVYISVYADGKWKGSRRVPYRPRVVNAGTNIPFVHTGRIGKNETKTFNIKDYDNATKVRITFSELMDTGIGQYRWRAGCRHVMISRSKQVTTDGGTHVEGNYDDWTDIIKWFLAWTGWYWPESASGDHYLTKSDGTQTYLVQAEGDSTFPKGRVWGDMENTGTNSPNAMGVEVWDKKPVMDGINTIRDMCNFIFFVDETGGAIWRSPNIWAIGNYVSDPDGGPNQGRTSTVVEIDENETLIDYSVAVSSANVRERVFIANNSGLQGAAAAGYNPFPSGMHRVGIWTDQNFETEEECRIMADLVTVRQAFKFRQGTVRIPAHPGIQIDDQIRLYERMTADTFYHYISGITMEWDADTRQWTYTLNVHWLGDNPFERWAFDPNELAEATRQYLDAIGKI